MIGSRLGELPLIAELDQEHSYYSKTRGYVLYVTCPHCKAERIHSWGGVKTCGKCGKEYEIFDSPLAVNDL